MRRSSTGPLQARRRARRGVRIVITGSGRCGTTSVARYLDGLRFTDGTVVRSRHETAPGRILPLVRGRDADGIRGVLSGFRHDVESAPYLAIVPDALRGLTVVHLIRDGRDVVRSGISRYWYTRPSVWDGIKPDIGSDPFEKTCHLWRAVNGLAASAGTTTVRLEDLAGSAPERARLLELLDIQPSERPLPRENAGRPDAQPWTRAQQEAFDAICGELMDRHYPGWR